MTYPLPMKAPFPLDLEAANDDEWFVAYTNPRCEFRAALGLREQGIKVYLPCEIKWRRSKKSKERVRYPLFVRYLFVGLRVTNGAPERLHEVRRTDGIESMVGIEGKPIAVPGEFIAALRELERAGEFDATPREKAPLVKGQAAVVTGGPFKGFPVEVLEPLDGHQMRVLLKALGGGKMKVDTDMLEAA